MTKIAANLSLMFNEVEFLDRFGAAAGAGFRAVEFMFPYAYPAMNIARAARAAGVEIVLFNTPAGDWENGDRGIAAHPDREAECREGVMTALDYAKALDCKSLHLMAGKVPDTDLAAARECLIGNARYAADLAAAQGIDILLEPINTRVDIPGYFYDTTSAVMEIIGEIDRPNVKLQYDAYHMQIMEGDLARTIERLLPSIGHIQIADNPGRNEPGTGEIAFDWLLQQIDALGYAGAIGCEYRPMGDTVEGLGWATRYL
ncbi:MAG: hydroxypyruvate isomerase [Sphingomonadales bacterium 63-6]|nr:MAG: hydroxypyruvate isomerase [Sphingomonadales bacterium 63-6]